MFSPGFVSSASAAQSKTIMLKQDFPESCFDVSVLTLCRQNEENVKLNANEKLFFIFEKVKETILDFLHGPVRVL